MKLYSSITAWVTGDAFTMLQNVEDENGIEFCVNWCTSTTLRRRRKAKMTIWQLVNPAPAKTLVEAPSVLHAWEKQVKEYENQMEKELDTDVKNAMLLGLGPEVVQEHVSLNAESFRTHAQIRSSIFDYLQTKQIKAGIEEDDPMGVYAIGKDKDPSSLGPDAPNGFR